MLARCITCFRLLPGSWPDRILDSHGTGSMVLDTTIRSVLIWHRHGSERWKDLGVARSVAQTSR